MTSSERKQEFITLFSQFNSQFETLEIADRLENLNFFDAPASTKYHGNYTGGLYEHSFHVAQNLLQLSKKLDLQWQRSSSPYIVGFFHDLCKCDSYDTDSHGEIIYNEEPILKGHGMKSVAVASTLMKLTEEEVACIVYHMGAFTDKSEWSDFTRAIHRFPNVLYTHTADMIAAHIEEVD